MPLAKLSQTMTVGCEPETQNVCPGEAKTQLPASPPNYRQPTCRISTHPMHSGLIPNSQTACVMDHHHRRRRPYTAEEQLSWPQLPSCFHLGSSCTKSCHALVGDVAARALCLGLGGCGWEPRHSFWRWCDSWPTWKPRSSGLR